MVGDEKRFYDNVISFIVRFVIKIIIGNVFFTAKISKKYNK